jgi:hypothetical protein
MLTAIEIKDHLMASDIVVVDPNESNMIIARLTKKGFRMLDVRLASCLLICIFLELLPSQSNHYTILTYTLPN